MNAIKILLGLALCLALGSCRDDEVRVFMPGTYVNSAGGEFSIASDTLQIEVVEGNNYQILRRTGYNLIKDGKVGVRERAAEQWSCAYSSSTNTLTASRNGKIITFFPDSGILKVGRRVYQKLN